MALTAELRQQIREAIHAKQKAVYLRELDGKLCRGCGCAYDTYATGCKPCADRRRKKERRFEPEARRTKCMHCGRRTRSAYGICTPCQKVVSF